MNKLAIVLVLVAAAYGVYAKFGTRITESACGFMQTQQQGRTRYFEGRVGLSAAGRDFQMVVYARLKPWDDGEKTGAQFVKETLKNCENSDIEAVRCKDRLWPRHRAMFDKQPVFTS